MSGTDIRHSSAAAVLPSTRTSTYGAGMTTPEYGVPYGHVDNKHLEGIEKATSAASALLGAITLLLVAGLVLGIIGYNKIAERLDGIEHSSHEIAEQTGGVPKTQ